MRYLTEVTHGRWLNSHSLTTLKAFMSDLAVHVEPVVLFEYEFKEASDYANSLKTTTAETLSGSP